MCHAAQSCSLPYFSRAQWIASRPIFATEIGENWTAYKGSRASTQALGAGERNATIPPTMAHVVSRSPNPDTVFHIASSND